MKTVYIDFAQLGTYEDFYYHLKEKLELPDSFGNNMDALYDLITGFVELPLEIQFVNMNIFQLDTFQDLILTLEEAARELEDFEFSYFLEQYDEDEE